MLTGLGLLCVGALLGFGSGDRRHWRWLGVAAAVAAAAMGTIDIWSGEFWNEGFLNLLVTIAFYVAAANLSLRVDLKVHQRWLRLGTLGTGAVAALLWVLIGFGADSELVLRLDAACVILAGCGGLALAVVDRLNRRLDVESLPRELQVIMLFCPMCRKKQTLQLGGAACKSCGLRIEVRAEAPVCAKCGYMLFALTSDRCPECGESIETPAAAA